ncbi:Lrp/AsnC family transcriptional regulator [Lentilitoribacter sp. EG35]|jgi:DNA-binding Lrp family transcriptional regulator|uniref:Lrp/AsnC family transcriptional regulator n=1 Tax=Lentilitoribacter sp. EG35 TaxID=3234192 RepID=UPI00346071F2
MPYLNGAALDQTDRKILRQLTINARMPATTIGKEIALSRTAVQDRIRRMEERGIIKGYTVEIDQEHNGKIKAIVFICFSQRPCEPILNWLGTLDGVKRVVSLSGELDCLIEVALPDTRKLSEFSDFLLNDVRIASVKSQIILSE